MGTIYSDLDKLPIEGVNGLAFTDEITDILSKYGIEKKVLLYKLKFGNRKTKTRVFYTLKIWQMLAYFLQKIEILKIHIMKIKKEIINTHINIGTGKDISIKELAELIKKS